MEASKLQKKKNTISKGKLKKNIKNVICRPDQVFWPEIMEDNRLRLENILNKYKVKIPEFKKPHWKELMLIPKENRPKPPKIKKVDGLLFGITECSHAIDKYQCSAIILESAVNPRIIVEPILEKCTLREIPVLCMRDLRKLTLLNFGVKTSCLGLRNECLLDVYNEIITMYTRLKPTDNKEIDRYAKMHIKRIVSKK
ncbi:unnamed protein product [Arctia plantaginis]|uniref:Ribosomal protein L7Ae/L30e/S12e/Gadd45 domain-containing protein n=1 Tax=Arctia plantaginis TaxID=874455 RepID=A0A8S0ZLA2_ARCPL|nr:unnamed protein product [Arctia plantaginis]